MIKHQSKIEHRFCTIPMRLVEDHITMDDLWQIAAERFGNFVKVVVDVKAFKSWL